MTWSCLPCLVGACHAHTPTLTVHRPDSTGQPAREEPCSHRCPVRVGDPVAAAQTRDGAR